MPSTDQFHDDSTQEEHDFKAEASRLRAAIDESAELRDEIQQKNIKYAIGLSFLSLFFLPPTESRVSLITR